MLDAALAEQQRATGTASSADARVRPVSTGKARNNDASALDRFAAVALRAPIITVAANLVEFQRQPTFEAYKAEAADVALAPNRVGVLLVPLAASKIGDVCLDGVVPCRVNMVSASHQWADLTTAQTYLTSSDRGSVEVLWAEGGTGQQWALVRLGTYRGLTVRKNSGADVGTRSRVNLIEGTGVTLTVADDSAGGEVDVTIASGGTSSTTIITYGAGDPGSPTNGQIWINSTGCLFKYYCGSTTYTIVNTTRSIATTSPLSGGGDFSSDRTHSLAGLSNLGTANYVVGTNAGATGWEYKNVTGTAPIVVTPGVGTIVVSSTAASAAAAGHVTTGAQTLAGVKTFNDNVQCVGEIRMVVNSLFSWCTDSTFGTRSSRFYHDGADYRFEDGSGNNDGVIVGVLKSSGNVEAGTDGSGGFVAETLAGVSGSFTTVDGKTVTVTKGIITAIV